LKRVARRAMPSGAGGGVSSGKIVVGIAVGGTWLMAWVVRRFT